MKTCYLIGIGMGNPALLTGEATAAIAASGQLVGAARMLAAFPDHPGVKKGLDSAPGHRPSRGGFPRDTAVLLSGDPGFYSGAAKLYDCLSGVEVRTLPGVSSLSYFCARLHRPWQDVHVVSGPRPGGQRGGGDPVPPGDLSADRLQLHGSPGLPPAGRGRAGRPDGPHRPAPLVPRRGPDLRHRRSPLRHGMHGFGRHAGGETPRPWRGGAARPASGTSRWSGARCP